MTEAHSDVLAAAAGDGRLWEFWFIAVPPPEGMQAYVSDALKGQRDGHMLPWVVRDVPSGAFERRYRFTDTWVKRGGRWQIVAAQDYVAP